MRTTVALEKIIFENYRCFEDTEIFFKDISIIVGKNNAGKSTVIEALRLIALAGKKSKISNFSHPPTEIKKLGKGVKINIDCLKIDLRTVAYLYSDNVAIIKAVFSDKSRIEVHLTQNVVFSFFYDNNNIIIKNKTEAQKYFFDLINIMPPISTIKEIEKKLLQDTVNQSKDTYLASRHFRNEIFLYKKGYYNEFKKLAEKTWDGLKIDEISADDDFIRLYIKDHLFTAEIALMGSGIQMWLQVIWFICRTKGSSTIILDEPDVYMHPDLQKKILLIVKKNYPQVIIATHSVDIISEVDANNIVLIDKKNKTTQYADDINGVQKIVDTIGSIYNMSLLRISLHRKCLFVEGKDLDILAKFYEKIYSNSVSSIKTLPCVALGGASRLGDAYGAAKLFDNEASGCIKTFCIIDRDYITDVKEQEMLKTAKNNRLILHIWKKKEIENYIIIPRAIHAVVNAQIAVTYEIFLEKLEMLVEGFNVEVFDKFSAQIKQENSGYGNEKCNEMAREILKIKWVKLEDKLSLVSGKVLLRKINEWVRQEFDVHCSNAQIFNYITPNDIDDEMKSVISLLMSNDLDANA